ncbi:MAG: transposase [Vicinamibacterales bacterium]
MTTPRPSRLTTFDYVGSARYFLTMCCKDRLGHFRDPVIANVTNLELLRISTRRKFAVLAYCLMPDHLHALIEGTSNDADFKSFVLVLRRRTTIATKFNCPRGLWQDGYHERVLRKAENTQRVTDYILNNPVRAGLVDRAVDYPLSWSCTWDDVDAPPRPRA